MILGSDGLWKNAVDPTSFATVAFAKSGATKKRAAAAMLALILTPEDCGAVGDGASHTLASLGYGTLGAAQADYPAATALSDEADWCALKYMSESSGALWFILAGKYFCPNPDLTHVIRPQANQRWHWGASSQYITDTWGMPGVCFVEQDGWYCEGLNIVSTGTYTNVATNNNLFTPSQFNSTVGAIQTSGQTYRNIAGAIVISGCDNVTLKRTTINHQTPGRNNGVFMGIALNFHSDGTPSYNVEIDDWLINDCNFGIFGYAKNLRIRNGRSDRYDQWAVDTFATGHLVYLSTFLPTGTGNAEVLIENVVDYGGYTGSDSMAFSVVTATDVFTLTAWDAIPSTFATGAGVTFLGDAAPAPLVLEKMYFLLSYDGTAHTFQVANTIGGAAIDITAQPGAGCRVAIAQAAGTMQPRYMGGIVVKNVRSYRAHGWGSPLNCRNARMSDIFHSCEIWSGTMVSGSAQGGVFDSGVTQMECGAVGKWIRITGGTGSGQKRQVIQHAGASGTVANSFVVDKPWTVQPVAGDTYEVGNRYGGSAAAFFCTSAFSSFTADDWWIDKASFIGEYGNALAFQFSPTVIAGVAQARKVFCRDVEVDFDVSRCTSNGPFFLGATDLTFHGRVRWRSSWPAGEKGLVTFVGGTEGLVDLYLMNTAPYCRMVPPSSCDVEMRLRSKNGKPIPFTNQWANEGTTNGVKVISHPNEAMYVSGTGGSGTPTITISNFGRIKDTGTTQHLIARVHDSGNTEVAIIEWYIDYVASGTPTITKVRTTQLAGTAVTTADVTQSGGVLSATVTTASSVTVTVSWSMRQISAH